MSIFDEFTRQYELQKTLRFELKPVGETNVFLEKDKVIKRDKLIKDKYENVKPFLDKLHRKFVTEALQNIHIEGLDKYEKFYKEYKKGNKTVKQLEKEEKKLRKQFDEFYKSEALEWQERYNGISFKKKNIEFLFEEGVFELMKYLYRDDEGAWIGDGEMQESLFDGWKGFKGYFDKFFETRKNFYETANSKASAIATRAVDQNLRRLMDNIFLYNSIKEKVDFSKVENNFNIKLDEYFQAGNYSKLLVQHGIDEFNKIIGGESFESGEKLQGMNELINEYRQKTGEKIDLFKRLDKQILSETENTFYIDIIDKDNFEERFTEYLKESHSKLTILKNTVEGWLIEEYEKYDLGKIYLSKKGVETLLRKHVVDSRKVIIEFGEYFHANLDKLKKDAEGNYKLPTCVSIKSVCDFLELNSELILWKDKYKDMEVGSRYILLEILGQEFMELFNELDEVYEKLKKVEDNLKKEKLLIKRYADVARWLYSMGMYFYHDDILEIDTDFLYKFDAFKEDSYEVFIGTYNKLRNYLTKKPESDAEKWRLNFENSTLGNGWDKSKERDNNLIILRRENFYYLGVIKNENSGIFSDKYKREFIHETDNGCYEKMIYKYFPGAAKGIPKGSTQLNYVKDHFQNSHDDIVLENERFIKPLIIDKEIFELNNIKYNPETLEISDDGVKKFQKKFFEKVKDKKIYYEALAKWIDYCKLFLENYASTSIYDWSSLKDTNQYEYLKEFYEDVDNCTYLVDFENISCEYINKKVEQGELYLFQIYNKDFSEYSTGKNNLHTDYFLSLFSEENKKNGYVTKLNGNAELFFRPKVLEKKKEKRNLNKDVIEKKRYTEDKIFFHVTISLNRGKNDVYGFNKRMNEFIAQNKNVNVIGLDRGEKHLVYYSVVDSEGKQIDGGSLNTINGHNYFEDLSKRAEERREERQNWQAVQGIKDLKRGYISQVVNKIAELAIEHDAIVVMENLNMRFKQIRGGIEKSVYQQLEKALIDKLGYLVFKDVKDSNKAGHYLKAYQLSAPFESFQQMGMQTGCIYYVSAAYTSKVDPLTGWRPHLYLKYKNAKKAKDEILQFDSIRYNSDTNRFEFTYDIKKFLKSSKNYSNKTKWTICSSVERYRWNRNKNENKGGYEYYEDVTNNLKDLFEEFNVAYKDYDILEQIEGLDTKGNEKLFKSFIFYFGLINQIRNTNEDADGNDNDYILSPVEPFFDSRQSEEFGKNLPKNGDENGAYNVARKGVLTVKKITDFYDIHGSCEKLKYKDMYISGIDWDDYICSA